MRLIFTNARTVRLLACATLSFALDCASPASAATNQIVRIRAAGFVLGKEISVSTATNRLEFALENSGAIPFVQSAVKQGTEAARFGPDAKRPYFTVRFAMPVPPENLTNHIGPLVGLDSEVFTHNHSPGFEILPNGDALAMYFSTPPGKAEADVSTSFVQARLRTIWFVAAEACDAQSSANDSVAQARSRTVRAFVKIRRMNFGWKP